MLTSKQTEKGESTIEALAKLNGMDKNEKIVSNIITTQEIENLDTMTIDDLRTLCRRFACQCGIVASMSEEETAQAMLDTLAETALKPIVMGLNIKADINSRMNAIDKWLDRKKGKPVQSLDMNLTDNRMDKMEIDKLIRLASMLDDPIIIAPLPSKDTSD